MHSDQTTQVCAMNRRLPDGDGKPSGGLSKEQEELLYRGLLQYSIGTSFTRRNNNGKNEYMYPFFA